MIQEYESQRFQYYFQLSASSVVAKNSFNAALYVRGSRLNKTSLAENELFLILTSPYRSSQNSLNSGLSSNSSLGSESTKGLSASNVSIKKQQTSSVDVSR